MYYVRRKLNTPFIKRSEPIFPVYEQDTNRSKSSRVCRALFQFLLHCTRSHPSPSSPSFSLFCSNANQHLTPFALTHSHKSEKIFFSLIYTPRENFGSILSDSAPTQIFQKEVTRRLREKQASSSWSKPADEQVSLTRANYQICDPLINLKSWANAKFLGRLC